MSSFGWLELENLTNDIDLLRDQLIEVKSRKAIGRVRTLEGEIARSEERRTKLLDHLMINMISDAAVRTHTRLRHPGEPEPHSNDDEHRAVGEAGNNAERSQADIDETSVTPTSALDTAGAAIASTQPVLGADNSPQPATLESIAKDIDISRVRLAVAKLRKDPDLVRRLEREMATGQARRGRLLTTATLDVVAGEQTEHHREPLEGPDLEGEARDLTELLPQLDHSLADAGHPSSASAVARQSGAEDGKSHLAASTGDENRNYIPVSVQGTPPDEVECEPHPSIACDHIVASDAPSLPNNAPIEEASQARVGDVRHLSEPEDHIAASAASASIIDLKGDNTQGESTMWDQAELERTKKEIESRRDAMLERHSKNLKELLAMQAEELRRLQNDHEELETLEKAIGLAIRKFKAPSADAEVTSLDDERASRQHAIA